MFSCHLFLISSASVRSIPFLSWNIPLVSLIFLKRSLVFPILLLSSISFHWSPRNSFLSLLAILWNSAFRWVYLSFSPLPFTSLLFSAIFKASSDNHLAFLLLRGCGFWLLPAIQCTYQWTAVIFSSIPRECLCHEGKETPRINILYVTKQLASAVEHLFQ